MDQTNIALQLPAKLILLLQQSTLLISNNGGKCNNNVSLKAMHDQKSIILMVNNIDFIFN